MDPDFRLYSQTRFSKLKLKLRQNDNDTDVLRCALTGATVNLATERGILVVETSRKDGKDLDIQVRADQADCRGHRAWQAVFSRGDPYV
jgi:hypothetical protein